jgi:hypothetical protein
MLNLRQSDETFKSSTIRPTSYKWYAIWKAMEEAFQGNNITTGPTQYSFVRQFLTGESLRVFNEGTTVAGNETTANLMTASNHLATFNCPRGVLSKQTDYLKSKLYKPYDLTTRQYVGIIIISMHSARSYLPHSTIIRSYPNAN